MKSLIFFKEVLNIIIASIISLGALTEMETLLKEWNSSI